MCIEAGYNFFARRAEHVELDKALPATAALKHALGAGQTNPLRDISGTAQIETGSNVISSIGLWPVPVQNYSQSVITTDDIDLASHQPHATLRIPCMAMLAITGMKKNIRWVFRWVEAIHFQTAIIQL